MTLWLVELMAISSMELLLEEIWLRLEDPKVTAVFANIASVHLYDRSNQPSSEPRDNNCEAGGVITSFWRRLRGLFCGVICEHS